MSRAERIDILKNLEERLNTKIIVMITGDNGPLSISLDNDIIHPLHQILRNPVKYDNLTLFLYSRGGNTVAALSIVSLIREFFDSFQILIPFRAHSAATLIALGANSIYMCRSGELSPVDVSLTTFHNPLIDPKKPSLPGNLLQVNVENLIGYINFSKELLKITEGIELMGILEILSKDLKPLAIGAVHRAREQNKEIAKNLMKYHMDDNDLIEKIAKKLTRGLYTHAFLVSRNEAVKLQLKIEEFDKNLEELIMVLFFKYSDILELNIPYSAEIKLGMDTNKKEIIIHRGIVETLIEIEGNPNSLLSFTYQTKRKLRRVNILDEKFKIEIPRVIQRDLSHGWFNNTEV